MKNKSHVLFDEWKVTLLDKRVLVAVAVFASVCATAFAALEKDEAEAVRKLLRETPNPQVKVDWENYVFNPSRGPQDSYAYTKDMLEFTKGVTLIGNLPHRHAKELGPTPLCMGLEGSQSYFLGEKKTIELMAAAGVKQARLLMRWNMYEKEPGVYDFAWIDSMLDVCEANGVQAWLTLGGTPWFYIPGCDAKGTITNYVEGATLEGAMLADDANYKAQKVVTRRLELGRESAYMHNVMPQYLKAVSALARHVKGRVRHFEYNNEVEACFRRNGEDAWHALGTDAAAQAMVACFTEVRRAVTAEIPEAEFSASYCALSSAHMPCLARHGFGEILDVYNYHGYERNPEAMVEESIAQAKALFRRKDGTEPRVMMGESGRATGPSGRFSTHTEYGQAKFTARRVLNDLYNGCQTIALFNVGSPHYGYFNPATHEPKLGYYVVQGLGWLLDGLKPAPQYYVRFNTLGRQEFTPQMPYTCSKRVAFDRKGVPVIALWTPEHLDINQQRIDGRLLIVTDGLREHLLPNPVVIDPIRRKVWDASGLVYRNPQGDDEFRAFPLMDYPLIVTDLAVFRDFIRP